MENNFFLYKIFIDFNILKVIFWVLLIWIFGLVIDWVFGCLIIDVEKSLNKKIEIYVIIDKVFIGIRCF